MFLARLLPHFGFFFRLPTYRLVCHSNFVPGIEKRAAMHFIQTSRLAGWSPQPHSICLRKRKKSRRFIIARRPIQSRKQHSSIGWPIPFDAHRLTSHLADPLGHFSLRYVYQPASQPVSYCFVFFLQCCWNFVESPH